MKARLLTSSEAASPEQFALFETASRASPRFKNCLLWQSIAAEAAAFLNLHVGILGSSVQLDVALLAFLRLLDAQLHTLRAVAAISTSKPNPPPPLEL